MKKTNDNRSIAELARAFVALELKLTNDLPDECRRLHEQHRLCVELTARRAWTEAGPQIDAEIGRVRALFQVKKRKTS